MVYLATHSGGALLAVKDRRVYGLRRNGQLMYFIPIQVASQHDTDTSLVVGCRQSRPPIGSDSAKAEVEQ